MTVHDSSLNSGHGSGHNSGHVYANTDNTQPVRGSSDRKQYQQDLQSVGLVAEACRDYERFSSQPKQVLTKQNSGPSEIQLF